MPVRAASENTPNAVVEPEPGIAPEPRSKPTSIPRVSIERIALAAIVLFCAAVRLRFLSVPLERDEGEYAYGGQLILKGLAPYLKLYSMKFPGSYAAYALIMSVFGQSVSGIHLGLLLVNGCTIILVFLLAKKLLSGFGAVAAAFSFGVFSLSVTVLGMAFHVEHLVILFAVPGLLLLLIGIERDRTAYFFWSGFLLGLAVLMKQPGAAFLVFAGLYIIAVEIYTRPLSIRRVCSRLAAMAAGAIIPFVITLVLIIRAGAFHSFQFWTIQYAARYGSAATLSEGAREFSTAIIKDNFTLWLLAGIGIISSFIRYRSGPYRVFIAGLLVFSLMAAASGLYFRPHYFLLILPACALLVGRGLELLGAVRLGNGWIVRYNLIPTLVLIFAVFVPLAIQRGYLFEIPITQISRFVYGENPFPEAVQIAKYIRSTTPDDAQIAVLGSEGEIYFYSNRVGGTGYVYTYEMVQKHPFALKMQEQMISEIEASNPAVLVYVPISPSWNRRLNSQERIFDWMGQYVPAHYQLTAVAEILAPDLTEYHSDPSQLAKYKWVGDNGQLIWPSIPTVMVFRRVS